MKTLNKYKKIVGARIINEIKEYAEPFNGLRLLNINSTKTGGGVAVLLKTLMPLFRELGIKAEWKVIHGDEQFFNITKNIHNALQGSGHNLSATERKHYLETNKEFADNLKVDYDCIINHDPQPCASVSFIDKKQPWIWRCHIDLSHPKPSVWSFIKKYVLMYDLIIVSNKDYIRKDVKKPQKVIMPSINPLDAKNIVMNGRAMKRILSKYNIDLDKPIISQVSRFDRWKDPIGVIKVFMKIKKHFDCKLVLLGSAATDDPEGVIIYKKVMNFSKRKKDITIINHEDERLVNALQTKSHVIFQKSIREGFGLTVSEALWKGTPVIGGNVGGIRSQIVNGRNGYLVDPLDYNACAKKALALLRNDKLRENMGEYGREYVRKHFLTTRHLLDWLKTLNVVMK